MSHIARHATRRVGLNDTLGCLFYMPKGISRRTCQLTKKIGMHRLLETYPNTRGGNVVVDKTLGVQVLHAANNLGGAMNNENHFVRWH